MQESTSLEAPDTNLLVIPLLLKPQLPNLEGPASFFTFLLVFCFGGEGSGFKFLPGNSPVWEPTKTKQHKSAL